MLPRAAPVALQVVLPETVAGARLQVTPVLVAPVTVAVSGSVLVVVAVLTGKDVLVSGDSARMACTLTSA
jgi:hypothetical protein